MIGDSEKLSAGNESIESDQSDWGLLGDWQRIASLLVAVTYLVLAPLLYPADSWSHLIVDFFMRTLALAFPLACIWFAEDLAEYYRDGNLFPEITTSSGAVFVRIGGWLLLLLPFLIYLLVRLLDSLYR
jgi:hypothetical protein